MINNTKKLPNAWIATELENISDIILGQSPPSTTYNQSGIGLPFYQGKLEFGDVYPTPRKWCNAPKKIAEKEDVLISVRAPVGPTNICPEKSCIGRGLAAIRLLGSIRPFFIFYLLRTFENEILGKGTGTTFKAITGSQLKNLSIPLPPLPEQKRIAAKIEELFTKLDAGIEALKKIKAQLKRYHQAVLKHAFEGKLTAEWREKHRGELEPASALLERTKEERKKLGKKHKEFPPLNTSELSELPVDWVWTRVGEISRTMGGKRLPKGHTYSETPTIYRYIRVTDFENMTINLKGLQFLKPETQELISKYTISKEDVYISIAGSIGKVGLIREQIDGANLTENAAKITEIKGIEKKCLNYILNSPSAQEQVKRLTISSNQPKLALFRIERIIIPLPPFLEQQIIIEEIERRFSTADEIGKIVDASMKQSERLRQSILKRAFEGKLVPQDPSDEPAEKLLERIKKEREVVEQKSKNRKGRKRRSKK